MCAGMPRAFDCTMQMYFVPVKVMHCCTYGACVFPIQALQPVSSAIDALQSDKRSCTGVLIPLVQCTRHKLDRIYLDPQETRPVINFRGQLAKWASQHIGRRFQPIIEDDLNRKAAALYPSCKLGWVSETTERENLVACLEQDLRDIIASEKGDLFSDEPSPASSPSSESGGGMDSLLFGLYDSQPAAHSDARTREAVNALHAYINGPRAKANVSSLQFPDPAVRRLFIKYNTAMPSSAACERLFSTGRRVLHYLRARMADSTVEGSLIVHINSGTNFS